MAEEGKALVQKFEGSDFRLWKRQMTNYLIVKDLEDALYEDSPAVIKVEDLMKTGKTAKAAAAEHQQMMKALKVWKRMDRKALGNIHLFVTEKVA